MLTTTPLDALLELHRRHLTGRSEKTILALHSEQLHRDGLIASDGQNRFRPTGAGMHVIHDHFREQYGQTGASDV